MTIAVIALGIALIAQSTALVFLVLKILQGSSTEANRLSSFASEALNAQLAKSLQEKAQVEAAKETHQMQVAYMADQLAKSKKQNGRAHPKVDPQIAKTDDGREIDLHEYDLLG